MPTDDRNLPENVTRQDVDPARRGREPETAYRQEELARKAAEEQNRVAAEREEKLRAAGEAKDGLDKSDIGAGEDKSHGGVAISVVPEAQQAGEAEAAQVPDEEAAAKLGNVGQMYIDREPGEGEEPVDGEPVRGARRNRKKSDD